MTLDVLLKGVFLGMKHAAPVMKGQGSGSIISTASVAGLRAGSAPHLYTVAKAAVIMLTKTVALELAADGIRVNCICPGFIVTPLSAGHPEASAERLDELRQASRTAQPVSRAGEAVDVANVALWLASDESAFVTGQAQVVDGGFLAGPRGDGYPDFVNLLEPTRQP